jgi:long-chain fatty acid transport protein
LLVPLVTLGLVSRVQAGGVSTLSYMPDHYTPITTTPVAVYTNPAALRALDGLRLFADGLLVYHYQSFDRDHSDIAEPKGAEGANTGKNSARNWSAGPMLYASIPFRWVTLGFGAYQTFGGDVAWDKNKRFKNDSTFVGAVDGSQRWHSVQGSWLTGNLTGAIAFQVPHTRLSFGVSGNAVYTSIELEQALTATLEDSIRNEGRMYADVTGWSYSFGLGVHWEALKKKLWLGLSYQAPPGLWRPVRLEGPLKLNLGSGVNTQTIHTAQDFPDILQAGIRVRPVKNWELRLTGNYMRMSALRSQCLALEGQSCRVNSQGLAQPNDAVANFVRRWHDTWGARLSASHFFERERYEVFAGVMYDSNAIPNSTLEPGLIDGDDLGGTLGGRIKVLRSLELGVSYLYQYMLPRDNRGKSALPSYSVPNHAPSADGRYRQWAGILNVNVTGRFDL